MKFDLVVIGSGSVGSTVASKCRAAGWSVAVIDSLPFGGTCALRGCDPKKVLVGAAELVDFAQRLHAQQTVNGDLSIDWPALIRFKQTFTDPVPGKKEHAFEKAGITSIHGRARFVDRNALEVAGQRLKARFVVIGNGAKPASLKIPGEEHLVDSTQFLELPELPPEIVFVGGGYIALEFAHIAVRAGARVTILHRGERLLEGFDAELVARLTAKTEALGVSVSLATNVSSIERSGSGIVVHAKRQGKDVQVPCSLAMHAAGRVPDVDDLDLTAGNVLREREGIKVNEYLQSVSNPAVYAGGDAAATPGMPLTPVAAYDGMVIAHNLRKGNTLKAHYHFIPTVVFTVPPLASVGLSEELAQQQGLRFRVHHQDSSGWYSSRRVGESTSAFKVLVEEETGRLLGAHVLGPGAEETINLFTLAMRAGMSASELKRVLFAYPTHASDVAYML